jgi:TetR/AcrR family transcriptional repressor of nem operon
MARPKAFDTTDALETAMRVFWERGYEATSIQDLVDALGVNRASLYGTFGDKAQLFEAAMKRYDAMMEAELAVHLKPPHAGREAVQGYLLALILRATEPNAPRGCLMLNTVVGCTTAPPALLARAAEAVRHSEALLYAALKRDGTLAARKDLHALARFFAAEAQGLVLLARTGARASSLREAANVALAVLPASTSASA